MGADSPLVIAPAEYAEKATFIPLIDKLYSNANKILVASAYHNALVGLRDRSAALHLRDVLTAER